MKDVHSVLVRLDREITEHHQQIATHQVEIMRLQQTRLTFMHLAEKDEQAKAERVDGDVLLPGANARPQLVVRPTTEEEPVKGKMKRRSKPRAGSRQAVIKQQILDVLKTAERPLLGAEIGDQLGFPPDTKARKPLHNALLYLRKKEGLVDRTDDYHYFLPSKRFVK